LETGGWDKRVVGCMGGVVDEVAQAGEEVSSFQEAGGVRIPTRGGTLRLDARA
jgi:hypothetical protein